MANAFTAVRGWRFGGAVNKSLLYQEGTLVIDTTALGGGAAGDLPAATFGLAQVIGQSTFILSDNTKSYVGTPSYDGASLMVSGGAANAPMDLPNGTYKATIIGFSAQNA